MIIPPEQLSQDALQGVLEEFIGREGTDYGEQELSLEEKVARLRPQVMRGEVLIMFDEFLETLTLIRREDFQKQEFGSPND
jgi:uncharacterized protein YheU (UPF0270 family)